MTTLQMECFLEAAKFSSFSLAAVNLYLSQPTLSRQIQAMEEELHTALFLRTNNTVVLTEAGRTLLPKIEKLYRDYHAALNEIHDIASGYQGRLSIGVQSGQRVDRGLAEAIQRLRREIPDGGRVMLRHLEIKGSYSALMDGSVDALLCAEETMPLSDKLERRYIRSTAMCLAVPAAHKNAAMLQVNIQRVGEYFGDLPYWVLDRGRGEMTQWPDLEDVLIAPAAEILSGSGADTNSLLMMVSAGMAITCVNEDSIIASDSNVRLIPMVSEQGTLQKVSLCLYWRRDNGNPLLPKLRSIWDSI